MGKTSDIYGRNPDGGAGKIAETGLKVMRDKGLVNEPCKSDGPDTSDSHDVTSNLGAAKP